MGAWARFLIAQSPLILAHDVGFLTLLGPGIGPPPGPPFFACRPRA